MFDSTRPCIIEDPGEPDNNNVDETMRHIATDAAPKPAGHYSQGVVHNGTLYVSGQLPIDPQTGEKRLGTIEEQSRQTLENVAAVLAAAGAGLALAHDLPIDTGQFVLALLAGALVVRLDYAFRGRWRFVGPWVPREDDPTR